jgi:hypothetical protein
VRKGYRTSKQQLGERARKQRQRQKLLPLIIVIAGALLVGASLYWMVGKTPAKASGDYSPEDVVYDRPLHAIHEMEPTDMASISFLPKDGPQPKIAVSEDFFNFGSVGLKDMLTHDFAIFNQGDAPLTISRAYTTCGCTTADFTATVIPPGKVSIMTLTFDAGFHEVGGQTVRRGVVIENNDRNNPTMEIWTQAAVRAEP